MDHLSIIGAVLGILLGFALYGLAAFIARSKSPRDELDPDAGGTLHDEQTCTPNCVCDQRHEERTAEAVKMFRECMSTLRVLVRESARGEQKPSTKVKA